MGIGCFRLVMDQRAVKLGRQGGTFGLPTDWRLRWLWRQHFQPGFDSGQVGLNQIVQQARLIRTERLGSLGETVTFEQSDFVGELLIPGFVAPHLFIKVLQY